MSRYHVIPRKFYIQNWTNFRYRWSRGPEKPGGFSIWCLSSDWLIHLSAVNWLIFIFFITFQCIFFMHQWCSIILKTRLKVPTMALYPNFQYQFAVNQVRTAQTLNSLGQLPLLRGTFIHSITKMMKPVCPKMTDLYKESNNNALIKF